MWNGPPFIHLYPVACGGPPLQVNGCVPVFRPPQAMYYNPPTPEAAEGGLHRFLQTHPALEVSMQHVHIKAAKAVQATRSVSPCWSQSSSGMSAKMQELTVSNDVMEDSAVLHVGPHPREAVSPRQHSSPLEPCRQSRSLVTPHQRADLIYADVHPIPSEGSPVTDKSPSEPYSSDRLQVDGTESDLSQFMQLNCPLEPEHVTKKRRAENQANAGLDQGRGRYNVLEEDESILVCVASGDREARSGTAIPDGESAASRTKLTHRDQSLRCSEDKRPLSVPCVSTCESMPRVSASTQTKDPVAADKQVNTEVYMADLDYIVELLKLKIAQAKPKKNCECVARTQQAELSLLALPRCCPMAGRDQGNADIRDCWPKEPRAVLNKLEQDYKERRTRILEGIPLDRLRSLSVNCGTTTSATPPQIITSERGNVVSQRPLELHWSRASNHISRFPRADGAPQDGVSSCDAPTGKQKPVSDCVQSVVDVGLTAYVCTELTTGETWYDAEEDLEPGSANDETGDASSSK